VLKRAVNGGLEKAASHSQLQTAFFFFVFFPIFSSSIFFCCFLWFSLCCRCRCN